MEKMVYNRERLINNRRLSSIEFDLLPEDVQMAYIESIFGDEVKRARGKAKDRKKEVEGYGYVDPRFKNFFEANGCVVTNCDFGVSTHSVKCVCSDKTYKVSDEAKNKLEYYCFAVGTAKAYAFESYIRRYCESILNPMEKGEDVVFTELFAEDIYTHILHASQSRDFNILNEEESTKIIEAELSLVVESIKNGVTPDIVAKLNDAYLKVLNDILEKDIIKKEAPKELKVVANPQN